MMMVNIHPTLSPGGISSTTAKVRISLAVKHGKDRGDLRGKVNSIAHGYCTTSQILEASPVDIQITPQSRTKAKMKLTFY
jgi:hypothetical protein